MKHLIPVIAMAILCHNKHTPPLEKKEGEKPEPHGGSASAKHDAPLARDTELNAIRQERDEAQAGLGKIAEFINKNFDGKFDASKSVSEVTIDLLQRLADAPAVQSSKDVIEGDSAILVGKDGKGVQEVYVIGVNAEKKIACLHGNPAKAVPFGELRLKKRGYEISAEEVAMREKAFPGATWDARA